MHWRSRERKGEKKTLIKVYLHRDTSVGKRADQKSLKGSGNWGERIPVDISSHSWVDQRRIRQYEDQCETQPRK